MKNLFKYIALSAVLSIFHLPSHGQSSVYLAEAGRIPFERNIFIDAQGDTFRYSAFYKGNSAPDEDIAISFTIDRDKAAAYNTAHSAAYKLLPEGSYSLGISESVIPQGTVSATCGEVTVTGKGYLTPFEKYLLPITVKVPGDAAAADPARSTVYYLLQAVPAPGDIERRQIGRLPSDSRTIFGSTEGKYLFAVGKDGVTRYRYTKGSLGKGETIKAPANIGEMDILIGFRNHHLIGLYRNAENGQLWSFPMGDKGSAVGERDKVFGTSGYNIFSDIISHSTDLYCRKSSGELMLYPLTETLEWASSGVRSLGGGWNHPVIFCYGEELFAVDNEGNLWKYTLSEIGLPGLPARMGSGWNHYTHIAAMGSDLIAADKDGILWRIEFNGKGFWAL